MSNDIEWVTSVADYYEDETTPASGIEFDMNLPHAKEACRLMERVLMLCTSVGGRSDAQRARFAAVKQLGQTLFGSAFSGECTTKSY